MSNLKAKLSAQLNKAEERSLVRTSSQEPCACIVEEAEATVLTLNAPLSLNTHPVQVVPQFVFSLNEAKERIQMLQKFVKELMIPGLDFGIIPGCPKPSLLKPGAEKLCDIYGFSKLVIVTNRIEDWDKGFFSYEVKATLINKRTEIIESEGIGCCNSKERKYKNQDAFSICNTILKMAKKRALVDAVLSATRSSGIFSQDIEEFYVQASTTKANVTRPMIASFTKTDSPIDPVSPQQLKEMFDLAAKKGITNVKARSMLMSRYNARESKALTADEAHDFLQCLRNYRSAEPIKKAT